MKPPAVFSVLLGICLVAAAGSHASPPRPNPTVTVIGTIVEAKWFPAQTHKGVPGLSEGLDRDRTVRAHFKVQLKDAEVEIVRPTGNKQWDEPSGRVPSYQLRLNSDDKDLLQPGMKIRVANYRSGGGQNALWSAHEKIEILSRPEPADKKD